MGEIRKESLSIGEALVVDFYPLGNSMECMGDRDSSAQVLFLKSSVFR